MTILQAVFIATLTAYSAGDGHTPGRVTASGAPARPGVTVAADTARWPFGTRLWVDGLGYRTVQDTGSAIVGPSRFDVYMSTPAEARLFGIQQRHVRIEPSDEPTPYPSRTPRNGTVPVATYCDPITPTVQARAAQDTPTPLPTDEPTPSPPPSDTPTEAPTEVPTATATDTPTPRPTSTRTPSPTITFIWPTDTPSPEPSQTPWLMTTTPGPTQTPWIIIVTATPNGHGTCGEMMPRAWLPIGWKAKAKR